MREGATHSAIPGRLHHARGSKGWCRRWTLAGREIASTLDDIRAVGADWVAIHPCARIDEDGSVRYREFDPDEGAARVLGPPPPRSEASRRRGGYKAGDTAAP